MRSGTGAEFPAILGFCFGSGLPLHVGWGILALAGKRSDVIDNKAGAGAAVETGARTGVVASKFGASC
jgi:hypothetical protein